MRVLALGGSGGVGRYACRIAAQLEEVDELVVADLDGARAAQFAGQLGPRVRSLEVDVTDGLGPALSQVDVVMNTVGPFFRFGLPILTAAIEAGCHYLDICDDWQPIQEMLDMHDVAVRRGCIAIIGMGASPGISNLLAVVAARELDDSDEIVTGWNVEAAQAEESRGPEPNAALVHGLRQMTGTVRVVREGRLVDETPLRRTIIDYPGLGRRPLWTFGHPEPLTLVRKYESLKTSVNAVTASQATIATMKSMQWLIEHHALTANRAVRVTSWIEHRLPPPRASRMFNPNKLPPLFGYATGLREGRRAAVGAALCRTPGTTMGALTGVPLVIALKLLAARKLSGRGVFTPETILDPDEFFGTLAAYCPGNPDPAHMVSVTRSWDPGAHAQFRAATFGARRFFDTTIVNSAAT